MCVGVDVTCRVRNEISQRSSLPDGQLVNEQRVLLINLPRGTALRADLITTGWFEIYCTAEFNYSIILSRRAVAISKIHTQPDRNRKFNNSGYFVDASYEFKHGILFIAHRNISDGSCRVRKTLLLCHLKEF